jgi:hypothetical protein
MMLVHENENQVNRLIKHLSKDFDVYIHIDKRSSLKIYPQENIFVYKKYKTYWGSFNQIMATLYLLKKAHHKKYDRYILISGQDLPIKTNAEIKDFFDNNENEYVNSSKIPREDGWPGMERLTHYHPNRNHRDNGKYDILYRIQRKIFSKISGYFPRKLEYDFYGGVNWTNYTQNCVDKIFEYLENDKKYIERYRWTSCADEIFYQTILHQLKGLNIDDNCLRYVMWGGGGM